MENELKILPEKWCILRTPETAKEINGYFNSIVGIRTGIHNDDSSWIYSTIVASSFNYDFNAIIIRDRNETPKFKSFTPISYEQFKLLVINPFEEKKALELETKLKNRGPQFAEDVYYLLKRDPLASEYIKKNTNILQYLQELQQKNHSGSLLEELTHALETYLQK